MHTLTIKTHRYFDGERLHDAEQLTITVRDGRIAGLSNVADEAGNTDEIDASSLTLLPGR